MIIREATKMMPQIDDSLIYLDEKKDKRVAEDERAAHFEDKKKLHQGKSPQPTNHLLKAHAEGLHNHEERCCHYSKSRGRRRRSITFKKLDNSYGSSTGLHRKRLHLSTTLTMKRTLKENFSSICCLTLVTLMLTQSSPIFHLPSGEPVSSPFSSIKLMQVDAVKIQRLNVPDLLVLDQQNQLAQPHPPGGSFLSPINNASNNLHHQPHYQTGFRLVPNGLDRAPTSSNSNNFNQRQALPESASLSINPAASDEITLECLISFDKKRDKNLIVKWYHEDRPEPIYQWIPELSKRSIASHYRAHIVPLLSSPISTPAIELNGNQPQHQHGNIGPVDPAASTGNQTQSIEAGFRLVRPTKELGGKYTCSAISVQNDDSKWKKMIVFTPPRSFQLNVSRTEIAIPFGPTQDRLIQLGHPATQQSRPPTQTTISPQMYSTIDYVNVNQQRARLNPMAPGSTVLASAPQPQQWQSSAGQYNTMPPPYADSNQRLTSWARRSQFYPQAPQPQVQNLQMQASSNRISAGQAATNNSLARNNNQPSFGSRPTNQLGLKLVCDIDQVFPIPEVNIYSLAKADGSHPDKLTITDSRIERNDQNGLYHVQVISILDVEELLRKYGPDLPVYFECLIALTNFELSKYADNKRSAIYWPGHTANSLTRSAQEGELSLDQHANNHSNRMMAPPFHWNILMIFCPATLTLLAAKKVILSTL